MDRKSIAALLYEEHHRLLELINYHAELIRSYTISQIEEVTESTSDKNFRCDRLREHEKFFENYRFRSRKIFEELVSYKDILPNLRQGGVDDDSHYIKLSINDRGQVVDDGENGPPDAPRVLLPQFPPDPDLPPPPESS